MIIGKVGNTNKNRGFGFVYSNGKEYFMDVNDFMFKEDFYVLEAGDLIWFQVEIVKGHGAGVCIDEISIGIDWIIRSFDVAISQGCPFKS